MRKSLMSGSRVREQARNRFVSVAAQRASDLWSKVSPRERLLISGLGIVLSSFFAVEAYATSVEKSAAAQEARFASVEARAQLKALKTDTSQREIAAELSRLKRGAFEGPSYSIAGISAQTFLGRKLSEAGFSGFRIAAEGEPFGEAALRLQTFRIQSPFTWPGFVAFLESLASAEELVTITSLSVMNGPSASFSMRVTVVLSEVSEG